METAQSPVGIVFPDDNRTRVDPTTERPYFWIGRVEVRFKDGFEGWGTGTLIDPFHVLTCAHNLYQNDHGKSPEIVGFTLALNGPARPYGQVFAAQTFVPDLYKASPPPPPGPDGIVKDATRYLYDYGLIRLKTPLAPDGYVYPQMYPATTHELIDHECRIAGYPSDKPQGTMWDGSGRLKSIADGLLFYTISTLNGQSGATVRSHFAAPPVSIPRLVGIHVAGTSLFKENFAVRITEEVVDQVEQWL
jgi:V8-like Glu-specific endopeptidase